MFTQTKNSSGFTLVELMVVVAIIGILSAIAVPNFKKYQNKSKQSEAKIQLAAVYNTEVAAQADFDSYGSCLIDIGYDVSPKGYYIVGFATAYTAGVNARTTCTSAAYVLPNGGPTGIVVDTTKFLKANASAGLPTSTNLPPSTATSSTFTAGAAGNIKSSSISYDAWTINESKSLTNTTQDI